MAIDYRGEKFSGYNKPKNDRTKTKKFSVLAKAGDQVKLIRYEMPRDELLGVRRYEHLVRARTIMINLMLEVYGISLSELGRMLNIDHSTVIHHRRLKYMGQRFWSKDKTIHEEFKQLKEQLEL